MSTCRKVVSRRMEFIVMLFSSLFHTDPWIGSVVHAFTSLPYRTPRSCFSCIYAMNDNDTNHPSMNIPTTNPSLRKRKRSSKENKNNHRDDDVEKDLDIKHEDNANTLENDNQEEENSTTAIEEKMNHVDPTSLDKNPQPSMQKSFVNDHGRKNRYNKKTNHNTAKIHLEQAKAMNTELIKATTAQQVLAYFVAKGGARGVAGGGIFNSVNYSTCLHRLARFATTIPITPTNPTLTGTAEHPEKIRKSILIDPRFAILIASLCEALVGVTPSLVPQQSLSVTTVHDHEKNENEEEEEEEEEEVTTNRNPVPMIFCSRELSNIAWATAKLKLSPPADIWPIQRPESTTLSMTTTTTTTDNRTIGGDYKRIRYMSKYDIQQDLISTSKWVRQQVLQVAKQRTISTATMTTSHPWIPTLSQLSGKLLDVIAMNVLESVDTFKPQVRRREET